MARVLLVVPEKELADRVSGFLRSELGESIIYPVQSEEEAHPHLDDKDSKLDLVLTHLVIPEGRNSVPDPTAEQGIALLLRAKEKKGKAAKIILVDGRTKGVERQIKAIPRCEIVENKLSLEEELKKALERLLTEAPPAVAGDRRKRESYDVEITLGRKGQRYRMTMPRAADIAGTLAVDEASLKKLVRRSHHLRDQQSYKSFNEMLTDLGEDLLLEFKRNPDFHADLTRLLDRAHDDISKTRFRFIVEQEDLSLYPLAFEAIKQRGGDFWMLKAPVSRRVGSRMPQHEVLPLFSPAVEELAEIRCLVVESETSGVFHDDELETSFDPIDKVVDECQWLEEFLCGRREDKPKVPCDCKQLNARAARSRGVGLRDLLESELTENGPWHLVHYAGHSYFDEDLDAGYLILPAEAEGQMEKLEIGVFGHWLRTAESRLLYLSSCDSSSEELIFKLVKQRVPAILGFRWKLNDASAFYYAERFYRDLMTNDSPSLEYSFLRARKRTYSKYHQQEDRIWAAPMLVMQS